MILQMLQDAFFAAIAAIGFAAISRPPRRAYLYCALLSAIGHSSRFMMMSELLSMHIIPSTLMASFFIGVLAVVVANHARFPAETCLFPSLLPMIPGIYAYKSFGALALCLMSANEDYFLHNFYLFGYNAMTCCCIILCMVIGATLPILRLDFINHNGSRGCILARICSFGKGA